MRFSSQAVISARAPGPSWSRWRTASSWILYDQATEEFLAGEQSGFAGEVPGQSGVPQPGVALILDGFKESSGETFQAGKFCIIRCRGAGQRDVLDVGRGTEATLAGEGGNPTFFRRAEADGSGNGRGGHALQV